MTIHWLGTRPCHDIRRTGGKAASLSRLAALYPVPAGYCIPAQSSRCLEPNQAIEIALAYTRLGERTQAAHPAVAVRSSAIDEDGRLASFAGQHETYLNIRGPEAVVDAVQRCIASASSSRALHYRRSRGIDTPAQVAVLIQQMVQADVSVVVFSADPCSGRRDQVVINAAWGLGESLVGGSVTPDLYVISKLSQSVILRQIAEKQVMTVMAPSGTREVAVPRLLRQVPTLNDAQLLALSRLAASLEKHHGYPVDIEAAFQGNQLYLLQCRPITALSAPSKAAPSFSQAGLAEISAAAGQLTR